MPDHFWPRVNALVPPRSPAGSDSPLSLVIGKKNRDHDPRRPHDELMIQMPGSPGRSSGFSESDDAHHVEAQPVHQVEAQPAHQVEVRTIRQILVETNDVNMEDGGNLIVALEEEVIEQNDDNIPLALVVDKTSTSTDGGNGCEELQRRFSTEQKRLEPQPYLSLAQRHNSVDKSGMSGIKIKDFARFEIEESKPIPIPIQTSSYDQSQDSRMAMQKSKLSESDDDLNEESDDESDSSSVESWATESMTEGVPRSYPCSYCDKVFANRHHLMSHVVIHTGERNYSCRKCGKSFGRKSTLRAHMTTHTGTSNFMCPLCDKACNDNNSLEEHIRMHTGEKPFVCTICSKAYARKSHLNVHYRVHTGERPFVCVDCGKDFTEKRFLNDHVQTAHTGHDGPLKCPNCFREFAYKTSLKQHLKKQMCVKNLTRGQGGLGHGAHPKQFACPFCEKSYSWKQTLKQHVSMYHRNKVHTDEFWKYELAKHRRTILDNETNEDMWQRQLGKHASSSTAGDSVTNHQSSIHGSLLHEIDPGHEDKWLDQIKRSNDGRATAVDMKLLAIRSLGASFRYSNSNMETEQSNTLRKEEEEFIPTREDGYLGLLANVSYNRSEIEPTNNWQATAMKQSSAPQWEHLRDIKEEPAAKRTQMWLAKLGQYHHRALQEEMDRSHDELWEEQIAKIKQNPIKSPLETVEITIDDEDEGNKPKLEQVKRPLVVARPPGMLPLMMSALQVQPPSPPLSQFVPVATQGPTSHHVTLTLHPAEGENIGHSPRKVPAYLNEENNNNNMPHVPRHVPLAPPPLPQKSLPVSIPRSQSAKSEDSSKSRTPPMVTDSVLKSLLLDPASRKRTISPPPPASVPKSRFIPDETDILRRRLLGLKDPEPVKVSIPQQQKFGPPSATITSKDVVQEQQNHQQNQPRKVPGDNANEESRSQDPPQVKDSYTKTSVLKHLLYRYTNLDAATDSRS